MFCGMGKMPMPQELAEETRIGDKGALTENKPL